MTKKYFAIATASTMALSLLVTSALAGKPPKDPPPVPPTVTAFDVATDLASPVPVITFTAENSDGTVASYYLCTDSSTAPSENDPGWSTTAPTVCTTTSTGTVNFCGWAKDDQGTVSDSLCDTANIPEPPINADTLDGLDSTDFAATVHTHSTADVTGLQAAIDITVANPVLPINYEEPYTCEAADAGAIVLTARFTTCACSGYKWVQTADGITDCRWNVPIVTSAGQVWMDRNLGASRVATSSYDSEAFGDLYQWGRGPDGHQLRTSANNPTSSSSDDPGHGDFIVDNYDWRSPQNADLWQGVSGTNNPCPAGFRMPTANEFDTERLSWSSQNIDGAYESPLKLVSAGMRNNQDGFIFDAVIYGGAYWSSTTDGIYSFRLHPKTTSAAIHATYRGYGKSVRCIQD